MAQETLNDEIKWLEGQLEAKKRALLEGAPSGSNVAETKEEKELVKDIIKEVASPTSNLQPPTSTISDDDAQRTALNLREKEHEEAVNDLVALTFSKGMQFAMKVANSFRNPHVLDEFHDKLADQYYEKMLAARKIK